MIFNVYKSHMIAKTKTRIEFKMRCLIPKNGAAQNKTKLHTENVSNVKHS